MRKASLIFIITILFVDLILSNHGARGPLKIAAGFLLVAFLPGYTFLEVVYRRYRDSLEAYEQIALAIPLSLVMDVLLGLLINLLPGVEIQSYETLMTLIILVMTVFSIARDTVARGITTEHTVSLMGFICLSLMLGFFISSPTEIVTKPYLSLSILPSDGEQLSLPSVAVVGKPISVNIQIDYQGVTGKEIILISRSSLQKIYLKSVDHRVIADAMIYSEPGHYQSRWDIIDPLSGESLRSVRLELRVVSSDVVSTQ